MDIKPPPEFVQVDIKPPPGYVVVVDAATRRNEKNKIKKKRHKVNQQRKKKEMTNNADISTPTETSRTAAKDKLHQKLNSMQSKRDGKTTRQMQDLCKQTFGSGKNMSPETILQKMGVSDTDSAKLVKQLLSKRCHP